MQVATCGNAAFYIRHYQFQRSSGAYGCERGVWMVASYLARRFKGTGTFCKNLYRFVVYLCSVFWQFLTSFNISFIVTLSAWPAPDNFFAIFLLCTSPTVHCINIWIFVWSVFISKVCSKKYTTNRWLVWRLTILFASLRAGCNYQCEGSVCDRYVMPTLLTSTHLRNL